MKTILAPTDFSNASKVAVRYAAKVAKEINAKVILMSVINSSPSSHTLMNWRRIEDEMKRSMQEQADVLIKEISSQTAGANIEYKSVAGFPIEDQIEEFAKANKVDFIVMGTKGATGLKKVLIGSNAASVIDTSSVPVITVPAHAEFQGIKQIVYAADLANIHHEIKTIASFAKLFNAQLHVLHVKRDSDESIKREEEHDLHKISGYPNIRLHVSDDGNIVEEVNEFVTKHKADMLAMFTHRLDFYERLFGRGLTQQFAFHATVPLLAFNKTNMKSAISG